VKPTADDADRAGVLPGQLLRRHGRHGAGAERGHGAHVHERERLAVAADDTQITPITTGQPACGLPGTT
jgi:hypothetical protein